eukprot:CAMPEP_0184434768 /NCGR_PEP_ID=MMETSP0738-20130409/458792_1 /TAXON_ID=385413 /ORGANISM="Thalassiosira miniscula, Strain CCMP1093" /LENGTH=36 /DNA_ID= /DNA_START= /DNA_END= /DNA_ORIENTATION=
MTAIHAVSLRFALPRTGSRVCEDGCSGETSHRHECV